MHRNSDADAAQKRRERVDLCPGLAFVGGPVEGGSVRALRLSPAKSAALPLRRRKDHVRVVKSVLNIPRAIGVFRLENVRPRFAAVSRAIDAGTVMFSVALSRTDHDIWVLRIDDDLVYLGRFLEADMHPRLAGIVRSVHTVALRAPYRIAGADIDNVRIGRRDLHRADAVNIGELVKNREPGNACISRFPNTARRSPQVENAGLADGTGYGRDAPPVKRADVTPTQPGDEAVALSAHILGVQRWCKQRNCEQSNDQQSGIIYFH